MEITKINMNLKYPERHLTRELVKVCKNLNKDFDKINIVCIGTDKATGDCLGPLVGTFLEKKLKNNNFVKVYGTLNNTVNALNVAELAINLEKETDSLTIAIDACMGDNLKAGDLFISNTPLNPGSGVGKRIKPIGDLSVKGVIATNTKSIYLNDKLVMTTRLSLVYNLSEIIAKGLKSAIHTLQKETINENIKNEEVVMI